MPTPALRLASASPRRRALLGQIGVEVEVCPAHVDERRQPREDVARYVQRVARAKAEAIWRARGAGLPVLGADTAVTLGGEIYGKPVDAGDCARQLRALSGRTHQVLTGVALCHAGGVLEALSASEVTFRELTPQECVRYWATGEPCDKAGGYAIQGIAAAFVRELKGSYSGVMGLPLFETAALLCAGGVAVPVVCAP